MIGEENGGRNIKKLLCIILVLLFFVVYGCQSKTNKILNNNKTTKVSSNINVNDIDSMTIEALPSPPKMKKIDRKGDLEKVIKYINSINKNKIKQEEVKGWVFYIQTNGKKQHSISLLGDKIEIDDVWYKINYGEVGNFRSLYNNLNYKEELIIR